MPFAQTASCVVPPYSNWLTAAVSQSEELHCAHAL